MRSGLLFHLCPPSGQFADLFGVEEGLRRRMLGMLGAKGLATFGMVSGYVRGSTPVGERGGVGGGGGLADNGVRRSQA